MLFGRPFSALSQSRCTTRGYGEPGLRVVSLDLLRQLRQSLLHLPEQLITFAEGKAHIAMYDLPMFLAVKGLRWNADHTNLLCEIAYTFQRRSLKYIRVIRHHIVGSLGAEVLQSPVIEC